mmetsp:Transcript_13505/g.20473  ORF Transcript_13505/g.20473 Transcript_13505/m.20473 type:complete len:147 (-) Transcript_13505:758-1198(-)
MTSNIPPTTWIALQVGVTIGIVICTTLEYFPGKPWGVDYGFDKKEEQEKGSQQQGQTTRDASHNETDAPSSSSVPLKRRTRQTPDAVSQIPTVSLKAKLDFFVYTVGFGLLIYIINRDYGNILFHWFLTRFPREAAVLGYPIEQLS